jgi:hypothetical protein
MEPENNDVQHYIQYDRIQRNDFWRKDTQQNDIQHIDIQPTLRLMSLGITIMY